MINRLNIPIIFITIACLVLVCNAAEIERSEKHKLQTPIPVSDSNSNHDVAVTKVSAPSSCVQGGTISIVSTLDNRGDSHTSCTVMLTDATADVEIAHQSTTIHSKHWAPSNADLTFDTSDVGIAKTGNRVRMDGDVNGDGYKDILLNGPMWNDERGRVFLYYGGSNLRTISNMTFSGENPGDCLGDYGAITTGDLNKDGYDDVILGAWGYPARKYDGRVYIYYGGPDIDNIPDMVLDGEIGQQSYFGLTVAASDIDQDGFTDLLVAAQNYDHGGEHHPLYPSSNKLASNGRGRVYLYWGGDSMDTIPDIIFEGEKRGDWFGRRISARGDVNGDNYSDILIGARHAGVETRGRAYLFFGNAKKSMDFKCDWTFTGEGKGDNMGSSLDIFDIDDDGYDDVILGARYAEDFDGRVYIHWGASNFDGSKPSVILQGEAKSHMGGDDITCGYFNEDRYGDIVAGGWGTNRWGTKYSGQAFLFYGNTKSLIDTECDHIFDSEGGADWFGISVSSGDVNNDNHDDILIGAPEAYDLAGRAYLYYGPFYDTTVITFNWDTTSASIGKHTLKVEISTLPGEQNIEDNVKTMVIEVKESI